MAAYLIAHMTITDPGKYEGYRTAVLPLLERYGARYLARTDQAEVFEGSYDGRILAIMEFTSMERLQEFWNSPEYEETKSLREGAATMDVYAIDGV